MLDAFRQGHIHASHFLILFGLILCAVGLREVSRSQTWQIMGDLIHHGDRSQKVIALTFDDGPTAKFTGEILEILDHHQTPATFFLIGKFVDEHPQTVAQIAQHGHEIGNHFYSHKRMMLRTPAWIRTELIKTDQAIRNAGYTGPIQFRPPFGRKLLMLPYVLSSDNRTTFMWSIAPESDLGQDATAAQIANYTVNNTAAGDIILLHPMYSHRDQVRAALPKIITDLKSQGFTFVTLSNLRL